MGFFRRMKSDVSLRRNGLFGHLLQDARDHFDIVIVKLHGLVSASFRICSTRSPGVAIRRRSRTNARMISMFTRTAVGDLSTLDSMATPCSVKTRGRVRRPPRPVFDIAICDIKDVNSCWLS